MQRMALPLVVCGGVFAVKPVMASYTAMYRLWRGFYEERGWKWGGAKQKNELLYFVAYPGTLVVGMVATRSIFRWLRRFMLTPTNPRRMDTAMELRLWRMRQRQAKAGRLTPQTVWKAFGPSSTPETAATFMRFYGLDLFLGALAFGWGTFAASAAQPLLELPAVTFVGGDQRKRVKVRKIAKEAQEHHDRRHRMRAGVAERKSLAEELYGERE